jgi:hypothetical protein
MDISELARAAELTECQRQLAEARAALGQADRILFAVAPIATWKKWEKKYAAALKAAREASDAR